jgi:hypothetical protein
VTVTLLLTVWSLVFTNDAGLVWAVTAGVAFKAGDGSFANEMLLMA